MKRGPRVKSAGAVRRVPLNMKVPPALRKSIEKAADRSGRSLCAEVEYRCQEYELLRRFFDTEMTARENANQAAQMATLPATKHPPGEIIWL